MKHLGGLHGAKCRKGSQIFYESSKRLFETKNCRWKIYLTFLNIIIGHVHKVDHTGLKKKTVLIRSVLF